MRKYIYIKSFLVLSALMLVGTGCFKDLNTVPLDTDEITSATVYDNPQAYEQVLAKLYAGLAVSGQQGPAGQPDISGIDEGFSTYLRQYWKAQELSTDEAVIAWNDGNIKDFHEQDWDSNNEFIAAMYNRIFYQISLCNEYLRETTDEKLSERGVSGTLLDDVKTFRAEARFLRALSYWHALDMFRNIPFVTEEDKVGAFFPEQITAPDLFSFIESELLDIEPELKAPRTNVYGRADQAADWMLLAKMYLNAETHIGTPKYSECITYAQKVVDAGFSLESNYAKLFMADNNTSDEIIFPIEFDGVNTRTWGGMTFVVHAAVGGSMKPADFGIDGGWGGTRTTSAIVSKFPAIGSGTDLVSPNAGSTDFTALYVPGAYQGWDPSNTSTVLADPDGDNNFEGYLYFPDAGTQFKFTTGPNWDVNFGDNGADGTLDSGGDNIVAADAGMYKVNVDMNNLTYTITKTDWGLIGSGTPSGWDSDQNMTYDAEAGAWTIQLDLVAGDVKFRANDGWDINLGDNGKDGLLEYGGDNMVIPSAGNYILKLFLNPTGYTYSIALASFDSRAMFYTDGQSLEIDDISQFVEGYAVAKFTNLKSNGQAGSDLTFMDTDFPLFRLADAYLMYAEAVVRGGAGGSMSNAVQYVNLVRERAYKGPSGDITQADLNLDFLLDERAREFLWECTRRTDLIRFGKFSSGNYVWPWKGGVKSGTATDSKYNVYPIPASDIGANPNLVQNPGY